MKLDKYLEETGIPTSRFATRCKLTYPQVRHILLGHSPTLETALRIEHYTQGKVKVVDLLNEETRKEIYGESKAHALN